MAFERREGNIGGNVTRYADRHLAKCPYCKAVHPLWLSDAKPNSIEGGPDSISYLVQCPRCHGVIEYITPNENSFVINDGFTSIKMIDPGTGTENLNLLNISLSPDQMYALINNFGVTATNQRVSAISHPNKNNSRTQRDPRKAHALVGMILGIIGLVLCFPYGAGLIYSIVGLIFSSLGLKSTTSKGKAIAGLVTSIIGVGMAGISFLIRALSLFPITIYF